MAPTFRDTIHIHMLTDENLQEDLNINDLELVVYVENIQLLALHMTPLKHISTIIENFATEIWVRRGSVILVMAFGPLLRQSAWIN